MPVVAEVRLALVVEMMLRHLVGPCLREVEGGPQAVVERSRAFAVVDRFGMEQGVRHVNDTCRDIAAGVVALPDLHG